MFCCLLFFILVLTHEGEKEKAEGSKRGTKRDRKLKVRGRKYPRKSSR